MDQRVQNRLKRDELDKIMAKAPVLDKFLEELTDDNIKDVSLEKIIENTVEDLAQKQFMRGVWTGYMGAMIGAYKKIFNSKSVEESVKILKDEANKYCKKLGIQDVDELEKMGDDE